MQQPPLEKALPGQRHARRALPQTPLLRTRAIGEGDTLAIPGHESGILDGAPRR